MALGFLCFSRISRFTLSREIYSLCSLSLHSLPFCINLLRFGANVANFVTSPRLFYGFARSE